MSARKGCQDYWFFIHYLTRSVDTRAANESPVAVARLEPTDSEKLRHLEAVLFLSRGGLTSRKLAKLAGLADATEARTLIRRLNEDYDVQQRAYRVEEVAGGYAILTRAQFASWLRRLHHVPSESRLSRSVMETLAIVAYRQPVLRADVEAIRGVVCSEMLKQLMESDLVRITGRSEDLGRPYLYGTTRRFLQIFGLRSTERLPRIGWVNELQMNLSSPELTATESEVEESPVIKSLAATALLEDELVPDRLLPGQSNVQAAVDDDDDDYYDDVDSDDDDDDVDVDDDDDDDEWDDDEDDEDEADEDVDEESEDLEEETEWKEVDDDDDGWEADDDDEEDDDDDEEDDWGDDDEEDEDWD